MKRLLTLAVLFCLAAPAALAVPPAGQRSQSTGPSASQLCKEQRKVMGMANFRALYAPAGNPKAAMDACLTRQVQATSTDAKNAAKACKAERGTTPQSIAAFEATYAPLSHPNKRNAFGKCVSMKAKEATVAQQQATLGAAKKCKAERQANAQAFANSYGSKKNAFGKCVSQNGKPATS